MIYNNEILIFATHCTKINYEALEIRQWTTILRLVQVGNTLPVSFIRDPSAEFQPGQCAELAVIGNQVMATVSNGTAPIGIIDDIRTKAFTNIIWNECVAVSVPTPQMYNGVWITPYDVKAELVRPNIIPSSFASTVTVALNPVNGVITFPAGTPLNIDLTGQNTPNGIRAFVNYTYAVANIPGDDSTQGSGRMTVWFERMFFQTDQYETNQIYPVRANVYVSEVGLLTTRRPSNIHPAVGTVTAPPSSLHSMLEVMWY
jgi:hypothetical protein